MANFRLNLRRCPPNPKTGAANSSASGDRLAGLLRSVDQARRNREVSVIGGDDREGRRAGVFHVASAMFAPDHQTSCRVVDHSHFGFRLSFHEHVVCPDEFALTIPTKRFFGIVRTAWQSGSEVGVSIVRLA